MASAVGIPYSRHTQWDGYDAVVIGSGLGGLSTAVLLARYGGHRVLVLEQHYTAGGFTHTFTRGGFEWDVGVHYVGGVLRDDTLLARLWAVVTGGRVRWASLGPVYDRIVVRDRVVDLPAGRDAWREALYRAFPAHRAAVDRYTRAVHAARKASRWVFLTRGMRRQYARWWAPLTWAARRWARRTTWQVLTQTAATRDPDLAAVLTGQYGDYGLPPRQSSFLMHALLVHHYWDGAAYPVGGARTLAASAVAELARYGGAVVTRAAVARILLDARGRVRGVRLTNGHEIPARLVISNVGYANTFLRLLPAAHPARERAQTVVRRVGLSAPHLNLYVGLDAPAETLQVPKYNVWYYPGPDHDANLARYLADPEAPFPMLFFSSGTARDPDAARRMPDRATVQVIAPANWAWFRAWQDTRWGRRGPDYEEVKARFTERLLDALYTVWPGTRGHVVHAEMSTPLSTTHFTQHPRGAIYGLAATPPRFWMPDLRPDTSIPGLYLTGVDVLTPGVAATLLSGLLTAGVILGRNLIPAIMRDAPAQGAPHG